MEHTTPPNEAEIKKSSVDFYAHYLVYRLQWKTNQKMDLGTVNVDEIALTTFWNLCLSDRVLTETEYKAVMNAAYDSQDARKKKEEQLAINN
ncbi:MAG: hypothetical protein ACJ76H_14805 [Bacteriovoracaceae bacterium]|jgi:hypothetical protein